MSSRISWTGLAFATCLLALSGLTAAIAQDTGDDSSTAGQDAQEVLGDRALPPDLSNDDTPTGVVQGENSGSANYSVPTEKQTETLTETREDSTRFSVGGNADDNSNMPVAGEIRNNPAPPPGWPGSKHANRPGVTTINAGPIWNNNDAGRKCPSVCGKSQLDWTGDWRTVGVNKSVCDCAADGQPGPAYVGGPGTYCEAPQNGQCRSCSVHCPGDKIAHCTSGDRGIFNKSDSTICPTEAKCECR